MKALVIMFRFPFWLLSRLFLRPKYQMSLVPRKQMSKQQSRDFERRREARDKKHRKLNGLKSWE